MNSYIDKVRWKSEMSTVIAGCMISGVKVPHTCFTDGNSYIAQIQIQNLSGSWNILKTKAEFKQFERQLTQVYPNEAGLRGHKRFLPILPRSRTFAWVWKSADARNTELAGLLQAYLREIASLPPYISRSRIVLDFLLPHTGPSGSGEIPLHLASSIQMAKNSSINIPTIGSMSESTTTDNVMTESDQAEVPCEDQLQTSSSLLPEKMRIKIRKGENVLAVDYDPDCPMNIFLKMLETKAGSVFAPGDWSYIDQDGDLLLISDLEDLKVAISFLGSGLCIQLPN